MEIRNSFEIPLPPDEAWNVLMDIPRIAPCMPGAALTGQTGDSGYEGQVAVRLGPVALSFKGVAHFIERDAAARRARLKGQGADQKGRGGASGLVTFELSPSGAGTRADITTEVTLSGPVAQYGRGTGVIQGVATQLCNQFADNLRALIAAPGAGGTAPDGTPAAPAEAPPAAKPINGFSLILTVLWQSLRRLWSRA
ncbi:SRPBCC family protein [Ancylobacter mangrovi]|uniref:SRPBCC family protein n=1 Tax=Ancylobacter mangrovi TaxID=2972472 RepID=UPI0021632AE5|nr:SRPBCC family protein [Ancylobacter mangrovi]MCS0505082.1 SRPBCC family protein [Ancylobacter mangrovi]